MIPNYQDIMLPLLKLASDEEIHRFRDSVEKLADVFDLNEEERKEMLSSGNEKLFKNRVGWAKTYLKKAGLLEYPKRGFFQITERGKEVIEDDPDKIDNKYLEQFSEFEEFKNQTQDTDTEDVKEGSSFNFDEYTPEEVMEIGFKTLNDNLANELLENIKDSTPSFFEKIVVDLIVQMGYGGTIQDAGEAIGKRGDEGIDGVIKEDILGLDIIYIQAKRWENTVGRPEIQKFAGALQGKNANKGIFLTTSKFSSNARNYAEMISSKIILINGKKLAKLMIENNVGVSTSSIYEIKDINADYFLDE